MPHLPSSLVPTKSYPNDTNLITPMFSKPRTCLQCRKRFIAVKANFICCSWVCSHVRKKELHAALDETYIAYPY